MKVAEGYRRAALLLLLLAVTTLGAMLVWALGSLPDQASGLSMQVRDRLAESGVRAEVTAVLLNFRGYDTLLEVAVLLVALLGAWYLGPMQVFRADRLAGPVSGTLVRLLVPAMIVVAGYVLWLGGHASGGAFQAGALLAAAGVLLLVTQQSPLPLFDGWAVRLLLVAGPLVFVLVGAAVMWNGGSMLEYPRDYAGQLILLIEMASALSIALTLTLLFAGGRPERRDGT
jgi:multisubunit Na+/H+ antiporter MnhB subunit